MPTCIFCEIVAGRSPAHVIWQDDYHIAFLSIFPNTEGFTIVIPKQHVGSYIADAPDDVVVGLMRAVRDVAKVLDERLPDVGRTGVIFEGFGVDHLHAKLFPMHGTKMKEWKRISSSVDKYFDRYEGYISSHDFRRADDVQLAALAKRLRNHPE